MNDTPSPDHNAAERTGSDLRKWLLAIPVLLTCAIIIAAVQMGTHLIRRLPTFDRTAVHPAVADAIASAQSKVRDKPRSHQMWGQLGMVFLAHEMATEAAECFAVAEQLDQRELRWPYLHGVSLLFNDQDAAIACFQRASAVDDNSPLPHQQLAELMLSKSRLDDAERHLTRAAEIEPGNARTELALARLAFARGDFPQCRSRAKAVVRLAPRERSAHELLSQTYHRLGENDAMQNELRIVSELPDEKTQWPDRFMDEVLYLCRSPDRLFRIAERLQANGRLPHAIGLLEGALQIEPNESRGYIIMGYTLVRVGDLKRAAKLLDNALRLDPRSAEAHYHRGIVHFLERNWQPAADSFESAVNLKSDYAAAYLNLGLAERELENKTEAKRAFTEAIRHGPTLVNAHVALGELLLQEGQADEARRHATIAAELLPDDQHVKRLQRKLIASDES